MSNKKIAGIIMLNLTDGSKRFLVQVTGDQFEFVTAEVSEEHTALASILEVLRTEVKIDLTSINLIELTNASTEKGSLPLFVFELNEENKPQLTSEVYRWETAATLQNIWTEFKINGVPMF